MTQKTELVITANATQATAQIAALDAQVKQTTASAVRMGGTVDKAVAPTRNLGQAALEGSRALEDLQYGLGGVINNVPSLVSALGGPMGLAGVISVVAVGSFQLYKNWDAVSGAFGSSVAEFKAVKGAIQDLGDEFNDNLNKRMSEGRTTLQNLKEELRDFGLTTRDKSLEAQTRDIEDMERRRDNLAENRRFLQAKANAAESARNTELYKEQKAILDEADRRAQALDVSLKEARKNYIESSRTAAEIRTKEAAAKKADDDRAARERAARKAEREAEREANKTTVTGGNDGIATGWEEADQKAREKANEAAINAQLKRDERIAANEEMFRNMTYEQEKAAYQRREQLAENHANMIAGITVTTAGILADGIASAALGQEDAVEQTLAALSRQAGGFITLKGGELLASGIAGTLMLPGNPKSLAELAGGAALVAAGAAVTAGGPAAVSSLMGGGGSSGSTGTGTGSRDTGASPSRGGGGGSGGPLIINVSYGAGGPLPEDVGREIARAMGGANRRRGAA